MVVRRDMSTEGASVLSQSSTRRNSSSGLVDLNNDSVVFGLRRESVTALAWEMTRSQTNCQGRALRIATETVCEQAENRTLGKLNSTKQDRWSSKASRRMIQKSVNEILVSEVSMVQSYEVLKSGYLYGEMSKKKFLTI